MVITEAKIRMIIKEEIKKVLNENENPIKIPNYYIRKIEDTIEITFDVFVNGKQVEDIEQSFQSYSIPQNVDEIINEILSNNLHIAYKINIDYSEEEALELMKTGITFNLQRFANELKSITG